MVVIRPMPRRRSSWRVRRGVAKLDANVYVPLYGPAVYGLECAVVAAEYGIYRLAFGPRRGLFWLTLAANALSYGLGLLLMPLL